MVLQYILVIGVGARNAILETMELLDGKTVPLTESKLSFQSGLSDLVNIGEEELREEAEAYSGYSGFGLNYREYLMLFLMTVDSDRLVYRSMDLMQGKLQENYDSEFTFSECIAGFGVTVQGTGETVFSDIVAADGIRYEPAAEWTVQTAFSY